MLIRIPAPPVLAPIVIVCLLAGSGPTTAAGPRRQPSAPASLTALVNIRLQTDIRVFAVMAALNLAGFDEETPDREMSEVRRRLRSRLANVDSDLKSRLEAFYKQHQTDLPPEKPHHQVAYTSLALLLSGPPDFTIAVQEDEMPADVWRLRGFEKLVAELYQKAPLAELWQEFQPRYQQELEAYRPIFREVIQETLAYFRIPARIVLDRQIVLIPDLLDIKEIVNARNMEKEYQIVVGPSDSLLDNRGRLQHEYLHFLIDPLVQKFGIHLLEFDDLLDLAQRQPHVRSDYQNRFLVITAESLIESIQLRSRGLEKADRELLDLFRRGLIFAPYFYRELVVYEGSELVSLPTWIEPLLRGLRPETIKSDEANMRELEREVRIAQQAIELREQELQAKAEREQRAGQLFARASQLMVDREFDQAQARLLQLLQLEPRHGNAQFYLAQIHSQKGEWDAALEAYRLCIAGEQSETWVRAWAQVRVGKILASRGRYAEARGIFEGVRDQEGKLRGAQQEARTLLAQLPSSLKP